jgi:hypothetical protein
MQLFKCKIGNSITLAGNEVVSPTSGEWKPAQYWIKCVMSCVDLEVSQG